MPKALLKHPIFTIIVGICLLKFSYILVGYFYEWMGWIDIEKFANIYSQNDTYWYLEIIRFGYSPITNPIFLGHNNLQSEWAFFPFYPYSIKLLMDCFDGSFEHIAFGYSTFFSVAAAVQLFIFLKQYLKDISLAMFGTFIWFVFPFHYYFGMNYTESPFLFFLLWSFNTINAKRFWILILSLPALVLLRPNGILLLLPLWLFMIEQINGGKLFSKNLPIKKILLQSLWCIPGALTFGAYLLYQQHLTGNYMAFSAAQKGWGKEFLFPLMALFRMGDPSSQINSVYVILLMLFAIWNFRKVPISLNTLIWVTLLLPLTSGSTISMQRYIAIAFPLLIMALLPLKSFKYPLGLLSILLILQYCNYILWFQFHVFSF